jgi:hypothetical protein
VEEVEWGEDMSDLIERLRDFDPIEGALRGLPIQQEAADEIERLQARVEKLEAALEEIAANKDMTLLGCAPHNEYLETSSADEEAAHQYGANKAFNQCAATARAALKESDDGS